MISRSTADRTNARRHRSQAERNAARLKQQEESLAALTILRAHISDETARHNWRVWGSLLGITLVCAALMGLSRYAWPCLFALVFPFFWLKPLGRLPSKAEYYALPHARDSEGKHRCVRCGHKAVERNNPNPNVASVRCARCHMPLFAGSTIE